MAAVDRLSPPGGSTYSSNTLYVGDGTWDSSRNTFLLPNLVGLNFETMRYNGMGNRFRSLPQYHSLILGHGVVAAITFLFIVPAAILIARFYKVPARALRFHIYLQVLTVALSTVLFILGFMAVGPGRSLTNPHHGIGVAIYVLIMVQALAGGCIHKREKGKARRKIPVKLVLHQWVGRAIALLGFAQVPLGLTLYGSPKFTFVLYAVWMAFLLVLFFILNYRAMGSTVGGAYSETTHTHSHHGTVIEEKKKSRFGVLGTLAAGAGVAALLGKRRRSRSRSRSRDRRDEVVGSRRDSASFVEEKYERKESGGIMGKVFKGAAAAGGIALAKNWWDKRQARKDDGSEYSSVAQNTPSRKHGSARPGRHGRHGSSYRDEITTVHAMEEGRPGTASGPGGPLAAAVAISAANRPITPRPAAHRRDSYDSDSYYTSELSPSRRPQSGHGARNGILATIGLGWFAKKMKDRRDRRESDRLDALETERIERERLARLGGTPSRLTGDGFSRPPRRPRPDSISITNSSDLSSIIVEDRPSTIRPVGIPPVTYGGGPVSTHTETVVTMPPAPPDPHGVLHQETIIESGSENYMSAGGHPHRRHSSRRRREGEEAAIAATAAAASLAAAEEERRRRSRSRSHGPDVVSPPVSVKVKVHGDKNQNVTLRRLTEQEAAAERDSRKTERRRRRADSVSSLSGTDTAASRRRYRRGERDSEVAISGPPPPMAPLSPMTPLSPPNPAFAKGRKPKDSAYYSGRPSAPGGSSNAVGGPGSVGSPESHGTWSAMSPGSASDGVDPAERRRRRRMERNQRGAGGTSRVEFS